MSAPRVEPGEIEDLRRRVPILFHKPQLDERVHWEAVRMWQSPADLRAARGGNRAAKTETVTAIAACEATGIVPWWFEWYYPPARRPKPPKKIWIAGEKFEVAGAAVREKLDRLLPPGTYRRNNQDPITYELDNGSEINIKSYAQGRDAFASLAVDIIVWDEKVPRDIFTEGLARTVDRDGFMLMALTPTNGLSWLYHDLYLPWMNRHRKANISTGDTSTGITVDWFQFDVYDNPFISHAAADRFLGTLTPEERLVRRFGEFLPIEGTPVFDRERVVQLTKEVPPPVFRGEIELVNGRPKIRELEWGRLLVWQMPKAGRGFCSFWDVSGGLARQDASVGEVIDRMYGNQAAEWHSGDRPEAPGPCADYAIALARFFNEGYLGWEVENHGHVFSDRIPPVYPKIQYRTDPDAVAKGRWAKVGWSTNRKTKPLLIDGLKERLRMADPGIRSAAALGEMMTFIKKDGGREEAAEGAFDDRVMALGGAHRVDMECVHEGPREERDIERLLLASRDPRTRAIWEAIRREEDPDGNSEDARRPDFEGMGSDW